MKHGYIANEYINGICFILINWKQIDILFSNTFHQLSRKKFRQTFCANQICASLKNHFKIYITCKIATDKNVGLHLYLKMLCWLNRYLPKDLTFIAVWPSIIKINDFQSQKWYKNTLGILNRRQCKNIYILLI